MAIFLTIIEKSEAVIASRRRSNPVISLSLRAKRSNLVVCRGLLRHFIPRNDDALSEIASVATLPRNDTFVNHFLIKISNLNL